MAVKLVLCTVLISAKGGLFHVTNQLQFYKLVSVLLALILHDPSCNIYTSRLHAAFIGNPDCNIHLLLHACAKKGMELNIFMCHWIELEGNIHVLFLGYNIASSVPHKLAIGCLC